MAKKSHGDWLSRLVRMAGTTNSLTAPLVELQAQQDARAIDDRVSRLEDPITALHPDISVLGASLYDAMRREGQSGTTGRPINLSAEDLNQFSRPLARLEASGLIKGQHTLGLGGRYKGGIVLSAGFVLYLANREEDAEAMSDLLQAIGDAQPGTWLDGDDLRLALTLPRRVIHAVFKVYESRGLGLCSNEVGAVRYRVLV